MIVRLPSRTALAVIVAAATLAGMAPAVSAADDVTPPVGSLTIGNGSGWSNSRTVTVKVPATDDVAVTSMRLSWGDTVQDLPYAPTATFTVPTDESWGVSITWFDAAGNSSSAGGNVIVDTVAPTLHTFGSVDDPDPNDELFPFKVWADDQWGQPTHVRLRTAGNPTWSPAIVLPDGGSYPHHIEWAAMDPAKGGSTTLGNRTVYVSFRDRAGNWSQQTRPTGTSYMDAPLLVSGDQRTGHQVTFTPDIPAGAVYPADTFCRWTLFWGNDRSLYLGERDDTFGGIEIAGPVSKGYCKPWKVSVPWVPYRQFLVRFYAEAGNENQLVDASLGGAPDEPAFEPGVDSTSRHITSSSLPLVYVLPEDYNLIVGVPATYRAYPVAGATIKSTDMWSANYIDHPERKYGGSSFTFTPKEPGHITVCWYSKVTFPRMMNACYDPPARYRDRTAPNTTTPVVRLARTAVASGHGVQISWSGTDKGWGIGSYRLERSVNGGAWARVSVSSPTARSVVQSLAVARTYRYRVRATDKAGNVGAWDYSAVYDLRRTEISR